MTFNPYSPAPDFLTETQQTVRKLWANVLRSGKYEQGNNELQTADGRFCCLGVLCDLVDPEGWQDRPRYAADGPSLDADVVSPMVLKQTRTHRGDRSYPSEAVARTAGLSRIHMDYLARRNDIDGWSFERIADEVDEGFPNMHPRDRVEAHLHPLGSF